MSSNAASRASKAMLWGDMRSKCSLCGRSDSCHEKLGDRHEHFTNNPWHVRSLTGVGVGVLVSGSTLFNTTVKSLKNLHMIDEKSSCKTFKDVMEMLEKKSKLEAKRCDGRWGPAHAWHD